MINSIFDALNNFRAEMLMETPEHYPQHIRVQIFVFTLQRITNVPKLPIYA